MVDMALKNISSMNFGLVSCETSRSKTNLPFIQINRRHLREYLCI